MAAEKETPTGSAAPGHVLVCCIVGLPGAGKSSLARALADASSSASADAHSGATGAGAGAGSSSTSDAAGAYRVVVISYDDVEAELAASTATEGGGTDDSSIELWHQSRLVALQLLQDAMDKARGQSGDTLVLVDDNLYLRSMRRAVYALCRDLRAAFMQVYVDVPVPVAVHRNSLRSGDARVRDGVIDRMNASFEKPNNERGWERGRSFRVSGEAPVADSVRALREPIVASWGAVVPAIPPDDADRVAAARADTVRSVLHTADLALRQRVKLVLEAARTRVEDGSMTKDVFASECSATTMARKQVLASLRTASSISVLSSVDALSGLIKAEVPDGDVESGSAPRSDDAVVKFALWRFDVERRLLLLAGT